MQRDRLIGLALLVVSILAALAAASASAATPNILDEKAEFTILGLASELGIGLTQLKSAKAKGSGKGTSEKAGTYTVIFEGMKDALGRTCTGLSDANSGNVTSTGTYDIRYWGLSKGEKNVAMLLLLEPTHLSCGSTLIKEKGCIAGQIAPPYNILTQELQVKFVVALGDNVPIKVDNAANTAEENCEYIIEVEDMNPALGAHSGTLKLLFTNSLGKAKNEVEVMA